MYLVNSVKDKIQNVKSKTGMKGNDKFADSTRKRPQMWNMDLKKIVHVSFTVHLLCNILNIRRKRLIDKQTWRESESSMGVPLKTYPWHT